MKDSTLDLDLDLPAPGSRPWYRVSTRRAVVLILGLGCVFALTASLSRAVEQAREAARRAQCACNFCQITLALTNYNDTYGSLPPAHVDDASGRPMHSWRVLILPFMEQSALYSMYNFNEPWNSAGNSRLLGMMPNIFACPSRHDTRRRPTSLTSYVVVKGPGTAFPEGKSVKLTDIKDGTSSTIVAVEVENLDIPWTEPRDLDVRSMSFRVNDPKRAGISSRHPGGANIAFVDGSQHFLCEGITPQEMKALFTIDDGESINVEEATSRK
jgi:prepilin-type processing-associated H-X9-DG protein